MQTFTTIIAALIAGTALAAPTPYQPSYSVDHLVKVSHPPHTTSNIHPTNPQYSSTTSPPASSTVSPSAASTNSAPTRASSTPAWA